MALLLTRTDEVLSRMPDPTGPESTAAHTLGSALQQGHVMIARSAQLVFGAHWHPLPTACFNSALCRSYFR